MVNVKVVVVGAGVGAGVGVVLPLPLIEEEPPLQPEIHNAPAMSDAATATRSGHSTIRDRLLAFPKPNNEMNPQGMTQPKASLRPGSPSGA
jgi:hypothetical protein